MFEQERKHLSKEQQQQIIKDNEKWVTEGFGGVDMSGFPDFSKLPEEDKPSIAGDRHGFNRVDFGPSIKGLQKFVNNPGVEALERVAKETANPELANQIAEQRTSDIAYQFINANPSYVPSDGNFEAVVEKLCFMHNQLPLARIDPAQASTELYLRGLWTVENLQAAFNELVEGGALEMPEGHLYNPTPKQLRRCELLATVPGRLGEAIENYCRFRIGEDIYDSMTVAEKEDVLTDPAYRELFLEAATWAFKQIEPNVTDEAIEFIIPRLQGRYPTVAVFKAIYEQYLKRQDSQQRNELLEPFNAPPERSLDQSPGLISPP